MSRNLNMDDMLGSTRPNPEFNDALELSKMQAKQKALHEERMKELSGSELGREIQAYEGGTLKQAVAKANAIMRERERPKRNEEYDARIQTILNAPTLEDLKPVLIEIVEKLWSRT